MNGDVRFHPIDPRSSVVNAVSLIRVAVTCNVTATPIDYFFLHHQKAPMPAAITAAPPIR